MNHPRPEEQDRLWWLADRAANDQLIETEVAEFAELLSECESSRALVADFFLMHSQLVSHVDSCRATSKALDVIKQADGSPPIDKLEIARAPRWSTIFQSVHWSDHPIRFIACAALLTAMFWIPWILWIRHGLLPHDAHGPIVNADPQAPFVASLVSAVNADWDSPDEIPYEKQRLRQDSTLRLKSGNVQIEFLSGATIYLQGPATLSLRSSNRCELLQGELACHVPPSAVGFRIDSPLAHVVDLGTEFELRVPATGDSLHGEVYKGSIEFTAKTDGVRRILVAGASINVSAAGSVALGEIDADDLRRRRALIVASQELVRLWPVSYDMPNGSQGRFSYFDTTYSGNGSLDTPHAPLTDGRGLLTDGKFGEFEDGWGSDGWVGWTLDPEISVHFDRPVILQSVTIYTALVRKHGILPPEEIEIVDQSGNVVKLPVTATNEKRQWFQLQGLGLEGQEFKLRIKRAGKWIMCDELSFLGVILK